MEQRLKDSTIIDLAASSHFVRISKKGENPAIFVYEHKTYTAFSKVTLGTIEYDCDSIESRLENKECAEVHNHDYLIPYFYAIRKQLRQIMLSTTDQARKRRAETLYKHLQSVMEGAYL